MTGHQQLIAMRRSGLKPAYVWVSDFANCPMDGRTVRVAGDTPELEDFRFLVGVTVLVESAEKTRMDRIVKACTAARAARVVASLYCPATRSVTQITDSEGVMTWPT